MVVMDFWVIISEAFDVWVKAEIVTRCLGFILATVVQLSSIQHQSTVSTVMEDSKNVMLTCGYAVKNSENKVRVSQERQNFPSSGQTKTTKIDIQFRVSKTFCY